MQGHNPMGIHNFSVLFGRLIVANWCYFFERYLVLINELGVAPQMTSLSRKGYIILLILILIRKMSFYFSGQL